MTAQPCSGPAAWQRQKTPEKCPKGRLSNERPQADLERFRELWSSTSQAASLSLRDASRSVSASSAQASSASRLFTQRINSAGRPGSTILLTSHAMSLERRSPHASSASSSRTNRSSSVRLIGSSIAVPDHHQQSGCWTVLPRPRERPRKRRNASHPHHYSCRRRDMLF